MARWDQLPDGVIVAIFKYIPRQQGTGRLVCRTWYTDITNDARQNRRFLARNELRGNCVSLLKVYELFPNLTDLRVDLGSNTDPFALFLWTQLERVTIETKWKKIYDHEFQPARVVVHTSEQNPEMMQLDYFNTWEGLYGINEPPQGECSLLCNRGIEFGLKGVGQRDSTPILHQVFGVNSKPEDWDAESDLAGVTNLFNVGERLPFFRVCNTVALELRDERNFDVTLDTVLHALCEFTLARDATIILVERETMEITTTWGGRRDNNMEKDETDKKMVVHLPKSCWPMHRLPLLPEHSGHKILMDFIQIWRDGPFARGLI